MKFAYSFIFTTFETTFGYYNADVFHMEARRSSYLLCVFALFFSLMQGPGIRFLSKRKKIEHASSNTTSTTTTHSTHTSDSLSHKKDDKEGKIILYSFYLLGISMVLWSSGKAMFRVEEIFKFSIIVLLPFAISSGLLNTLINTQISLVVSKNEIGHALGVGASIASLTRIIAPAVGGALVDSFGVSAPGLFGFFISMVIILYIHYFQIQSNLSILLSPQAITSTSSSTISSPSSNSIL